MHWVWWFWVNRFWWFALPIVTAILLIPGLYSRLHKGVIRRWCIRNYGIHGYFMIPNVKLILIVPIFATMFVNSDISDVFFALYWTFSVIVDVVDVITGGDKPKKRRLRKLAAELKKRFAVKPVPKPVFGA